MKSAENTAVTDRVLKEHEFESHFSFDIRPHVRVTEYEKGEYIIRNTDQLGFSTWFRGRRSCMASIKMAGSR